MDRTTRALLACGMLAPIIFIAVFMIEGALRPDYSAMRHMVSTLALTERGVVQIASFLVTGTLLLTASLGWRRALAGGRAARAGPVILAIVGVGFLFAGAFVADPAFGYPAGVATPTTISPSAGLHMVGAFLIFPGIAAAGLVLARRFGDDKLASWRWGSVATAVIVLAIFFLVGGLAAADASGVAAPLPVGLVQRIALVAGLGWIAFVSWKFARARLPDDRSA